MKKSNQKELNRYKGCLVGLAVGDALGLPYEFEFPTPKVTDFCKIPGRHKQPVGTWSDDTSMSLCLAESLLKRKTNCQLDQLYTYLRWYRNGHMTCHGVAIGMGNRTIEALRKFEADGTNLTFQGDQAFSGNGSLMRIAPIAMYYASAKNNMKIIAQAKISSQTTHDTPLCNTACELYALAIKEALHGKSKAEIFKTMSQFSKTYTNDTALIIHNKTYKNKKQLKANGYVVNSFRAALYCFYKSTDFKSGALMAVNLGYDCDTTAAIYGALAGAYYGYTNIPLSWRKKLLKRDLIETIATKLLNERGV